MRLLLAVEPVDFRKGIDGMAAVVRRVLSADPFDGTMFLFRNRRASAIKVLIYDGQGFWLCQKRLSRSRFTWWPAAKDDRRGLVLAAHQVQQLLWNGEPALAGGETWKKIATPAFFTGHRKSVSVHSADNQ
jgi:hypothetical protein